MRLFILSFIILSCQNDPQMADQKIAHELLITEEFIYELEDALTPECHASTVAESNGIILASWFGGTEEKNDDVGIWVSRKIDKSWTKPLEVVNGVQADGSRYPCWNPVLFKPSGKTLYLYYKVGPNPKEWWGMYLRSEDDGESWSAPEKLPDGILGPIKNQPIQLANGTIMSPSSTESNEGIWKIHMEMSEDKGTTWSKTEALNDTDEFDAIQPLVYNHGDGKLQLLSRTKNSVIGENWSEDFGKTWSPMKAMDLPNPNSGIDGQTLSDGRHLLIYNPTEKNWGARVPLSVAISSDGITWERILDLESGLVDSPYEKEEYSYPTVIQSSDDKIHIVYTWNRKTVKYVVLDPKAITP